MSNEQARPDREVHRWPVGQEADSRSTRSGSLRILIVLLVVAGTTLALFAVAAWHGNDVPEACAQCDAGWYARIAVNGYPDIPAGGDLGHWYGPDVHQTEWAFFPLYPWLLNTVSKAGMSIPMAMLVLALVLCGLWGLLALRFFSRLQGERRALYTVLSLFLQPFGIYFHLGMTESLFFVGLLWAFLSVTERSRTGLTFSSSILVLARPNGLFLLPVLLVYAMECDKVDKWSAWRRSSFWKYWLPPFSVPIVLFAAYGIYQWKHTGDPFAFSAAQAGWGRHFTWPFMGFFNAGDMATQFDSCYTIALVGLIILVRKQLTLSFKLLLWVSILLPLCSGSVASMPRFTSLMFPLFLVVGRWLEQHRTWGHVVLLISWVLQLGWFWLWLQGDLVTC